jgi:hypothetical protein
MPEHKPRFRRLLLSRVDHDVLDRIEHLLLVLGYTPVRLRHKIFCHEIEVDVDVRNDINWIETGEHAELDKQVDLLFEDLVLTGKNTQARCSDCYAHFTAPEHRLVEPRASRSCEASQARYPVKLVIEYPDEEDAA